MADYGKPEDSPWYICKDHIQELTFEEGVTKIGANTFARSEQIRNIHIPLSMRSIGKDAFTDCRADDVICYPAADNLQMESNVFKNKPMWHVFDKQLDGYWEKLDREALTAKMEDILENGSSEETEIFADDNVTLIRIGEDHAEEEAAHGRLALIYKEGNFALTIGEHESGVPDISNMTMVLAARVVFSDKSGYYEIRSEKSSKTNLRKYVIARDLLKGIVKE